MQNSQEQLNERLDSSQVLNILLKIDQRLTAMEASIAKNYSKSFHPQSSGQKVAIDSQSKNTSHKQNKQNRLLHYFSKKCQNIV